MRTALDTNILSALWSGEPLASQISADLAAYRAVGGIVICGPVFAELAAHPNASQTFIEEFLKETGVGVDFHIDEDIWRRAAQAYAEYGKRRRHSAGGAPKRLLVDFIIAAHAGLRADRLMTLDPQRYRQDFPKLKLV